MANEIIKAIVTKLLSGRFLATVLVISTYCLCILGSLYATIKGIIKVEVFLGIFAGFTGLAGTIINGYFERKDREVKNV